jgi:hypothetical protein
LTGRAVEDAEVAGHSALTPRGALATVEAEYRDILADRNPEFQDRIVAETRALLSTVLS